MYEKRTPASLLGPTRRMLSAVRLSGAMQLTGALRLSGAVRRGTARLSSAVRQLTGAVLVLSSTVVVLGSVSCAHPAERALEGRWNGESVENFNPEEIAAATGWARGTSFVFRGKNLRVTVPAEPPRTGVYQLAAIENQNLSLTVLDTQGQESQLDLIVDDAESLRWLLDDGRAVVLKKQP